MKNNLILLLIGLCLGGTALAENGKISSLVFFDYTTNADQNAIDGFGLGRVYFTYETKLSDALKFKFQTDVDAGNVPMNLYIKIAQVDWNTAFGKVTFGLQGMNTFSVQEKNWGLRYIEKSPMDLYKWANSADMGVGYSYTVREKLHLSAKFVNGAGYKSAETDSYKKGSFQIAFGEVALPGKTGFNVGSIFTYEPYDYSSGLAAPEKKSTIVYGAFGGLSVEKKFRLGGEFQRCVKSGPDLTLQIFSVYGNYSLMTAVDLFGRFDLMDPDVDSDDDGESYTILGLSYLAAKGLTIAPNFRYTSYQGNSDPDKLFKINFEFKIS